MSYPVSIKNTQPTETIEIRWCPTNKCNFSCWYCFPNSNTGTHGAPNDLNLITKHFKHIFDSYKTYLGKDKFHFVITGGEPTLWSDFGKFLKDIKQDNIYLTVISNASRTLRWWKEYGKFIDNATLSYHISQADIDHHIEVADELYSQGIKVTVLVLMDPNRWEDCVNAISYMKLHSKHRWFIEAKHITDVDSINYTNEQQSFLKKEIKQLPSPIWFVKNIKLLTNGTIRKYRSIADMADGTKLKATSATYLAHEYTNFKDWECSIGQEAIYINWDGTVSGSCGQPLFGSNYYNILDNSFIDEFVPNYTKTVCGSTMCSCLPDTHITKQIL
jgi:organic radical activating enzyme